MSRIGQSVIIDQAPIIGYGEWEIKGNFVGDWEPAVGSGFLLTDVPQRLASW